MTVDLDLFGYRNTHRTRCKLKNVERIFAQKFLKGETKEEWRLSFGKGLVQSVRPLSYNSKLKVTVAKYYTPSGRCIQKIDYSKRDENGKVKAIADSLITEFKTLKNNRSVFDGNGIAPDIKASRKEISDISATLLMKNLFFDI